MFPRVVYPLCRLILISTVVHQFADRGDGVRRYLDQVKIPFTGYVKRTLWRHYSDPLAVFVDQAHFTRTYSLINPRFSRTVVPPNIPVNRPDLLLSGTGKNYT